VRHLQGDAAREEHARVAAVGLAGGRVGVRREVALQHVLRHAEQPLGRHLARPRTLALSPPVSACACVHVAVAIAAAAAGAPVRPVLPPVRQALPGPPDSRGSRRRHCRPRSLRRPARLWRPSPAPRAGRARLGRAGSAGAQHAAERAAGCINPNPDPAHLDAHIAGLGQRQLGLLGRDAHVRHRAQEALVDLAPRAPPLARRALRLRGRAARPLHLRRTPRQHAVPGRPSRDRRA